MAYTTMSTQVTGYVVLASDWNEIANNFPLTLPGLVGADGEIGVATAANATKKLLAFTGDLLLHELGALEVDVSGYDGLPLIDSGATTNLKVAFGKTAAPGANDDTTDGWVAGSIWVDTTNDNAYICVDNTDTAAVWLLIGGTGAQIFTGTYTGDGSTDQGITGVGFTPKWVHITERNTTDNTTTGNDSQSFTSDVIIDDLAAGAAMFDQAANSPMIRDNGIITMDADGFSVDDAGADSHPNENLTLYNFVAIG